MWGVWVWRHEHQQRQSSGAGVFYPVLQSRSRQADVMFCNPAFCRSDTNGTLAFENEIDFVRAAVRVRFLLLTRLQTIHIAEEILGFK